MLNLFPVRGLVSLFVTFALQERFAGRLILISWHSPCPFEWQGELWVRVRYTLVVLNRPVAYDECVSLTDSPEFVPSLRFVPQVRLLPVLLA